MAKRTEAQLRKIAAQARDELLEIEERRRAKELRAHVGKCFRYRNSYSCPSEPSDYWYVYRKALFLDGAALSCLEFEKDKYGEWKIHNNTVHSGMFGWQEISAKEFKKAWDECVAEIQSYNDGGERR